MGISEGAYGYRGVRVGGEQLLYSLARHGGGWGMPLCRYTTQQRTGKVGAGASA